MPLHLFRSNRLEFLATVLGELLSTTPPTDPFEPVRVVVGSRGMARWLRHRLAERLTICANVAFPFPEATLDGVMKAVVPDIPRQDAWAPDSLAWTLIDQMQEVVQQPGFEWLIPYMPDDGVITPRQWAVARQIADVFDRYITYRPQLAVAWSAGKTTELDLGDLAWQPVLWHRIATQLDAPHRAQRASAAIAALTAGTVPQGYGSIRIFGVSSLPPAWLDLLGATAQHADVELYLLCPSSEYWADLRRRFRGSQVAWRQLDREDVPQQLGVEPFAGNPLLAALGRQARDFQLVLESQDEAYEDRRVDLFADPAQTEPSALHHLQSDVLNAVAPASQRPIAPGDNSIQLHACYGATRQVEALRDSLLKLLNDDPTLHPRDILVMTPDIRTFAPIISAVFSQGRTHRASEDGRTDYSAQGWGSAGAPQIPFEIADLSVRDRNPVADALVRVLELVTSRVRASEVLDLLNLTPVRDRFSLSAQDMPRVQQWIADSGIRWGLDADHRAEHDQPKDAQNTWAFGIERMLCGVCMSNTDQLALGTILPFDPLEGSDSAIAGRLIHYVRTLTAELRDLRESRSVRDWVARLTQTVEHLTAVTEDTAWHTLTVTEALDALAQEASRAERPRLANIRVMARVIAERFERVSGQSREQSGATTFTALAPMRSVPYRVVCLLGLDEGALPRTVQPSPFDLTARHPRAGDRDLRDEDRFLFLEAVLAAREHLLLTWTGRDVHSNEERAPATPLSELIAVIDRTVASPVTAVSASDYLTTHHPLAAHSRDNFGHSEPPRSFDRALLAGAVATASQQASQPPFFPQGNATEAARPPERQLALDELIRFLERPTEHLLRRQLAVDLRDDANTIVDREPIELEGLASWSLWDRIVTSRLTGLSTDALHPLLAAQGSVPLGYAGAHITQQWSDVVQEALAAAGLLTQDGGVRPADPALIVDLQLDTTRLIGSLERCWSDTLIYVQYGSESARRWIRPWVELLAWCAMAPGPQRAIVVWRKDNQPNLCGLQTPANPREVLSQLIALYWRGCSEPLPLFPATSYAFAKSAKVHPDHICDALTQQEVLARGAAGASTAWLTHFGGDGIEPHVVKLYGPLSQPPMSEAFAHAALTLFSPILHQRVTSSVAKTWVTA